MTNLFLPLVAGGGDVNDPVNFTFFIGCMAMMAASAFFSSSNPLKVTRNTSPAASR